MVSGVRKIIFLVYRIKKIVSMWPCVGQKEITDYVKMWKEKNRGTISATEFVTDRTISKP